MPKRSDHRPSLLSYIALAAAVAVAAMELDRRMTRRAAEGQGHGDIPRQDDRTTAEDRGRHDAVAFSARANAAVPDTPDCDVVRPAGRGAMRDPPSGWDEVDEWADESFPASDPPTNY